MNEEENTKTNNKQEQFIEENTHTHTENRWKKSGVKMMTRVAIFGAIAAILYVVPGLQFKIPTVFGPFLEFHFDEIPAFIAGFAFGPLEGFLVVLVRTIIKLPFTSTLCVGEISDLIYSTAFVVPAAFIYRKHRNLKGTVIGFTVGCLLQILSSALCNSLFMIDFYLKLFGITNETMLSIFHKINPAITDTHFTLIVFIFVPFNMLKDLVVILVTTLVYKRIHILIEKIDNR